MTLGRRSGSWQIRDSLMDCKILTAVQSGAEICRKLETKEQNPNARVLTNPLIPTQNRFSIPNPRLKPRLRSDWSAVRSECFQGHLDFCSYPHLNNSSCRDYKSATKELLCGDQESSGTSQQTTRRINMFEAYRGPKLTEVKSETNIYFRTNL